MAQRFLFSNDLGNGLLTAVFMAGMAPAAPVEPREHKNCLVSSRGVGHILNSHVILRVTTMVGTEI